MSTMIVYHHGDKRAELALPKDVSNKERQQIIQKALGIPCNGKIFIISRTNPSGIYHHGSTLSPIDEYDVVWWPSMLETIKRSWRREGSPPHPSNKKYQGVDMPEFIDESKEKSHHPTVFVSRKLKVYHNQPECDKGEHSKKILLSEAKKRGMDRCLYCTW